MVRVADAYLSGLGGGECLALGDHHLADLAGGLALLEEGVGDAGHVKAWQGSADGDASHRPKPHQIWHLMGRAWAEAAAAKSATRATSTREARIGGGTGK